MLFWLPTPILAAISFTLHTINTFFWTPLIFLLALVKLVLPLASVRRFLSEMLNRIAVAWVSCNGLIHSLTKKIEWKIEGDTELLQKEWYLVIANHQSWADIFVLQHVLNRRIPLLKFFLKHELIYVPVLGLAWWALDFPFMRRFTKSYLAKHPGMKGKDSETTKKACEKFRHSPIAVMNFIEGTRFTEGKQKQQNSPFTHLLKPKAGGVGLVLSAMGEQLHTLLDVTIIYDQKNVSFWDFLGGKVQRVYVHIHSLPIDAQLLGDYDNDPVYRARFQTWLNSIWREKDQRIAATKR
jgi:1-acyl-sn-glycerol-3-phosphate acyltransferase